MPNVKTPTLTGGETAVTFDDNHPYYMITNMSDGEIYASGNPDIVPYADGVYTILPGVETRISPECSGDTVYLLGSGKVQIRAETIAVPASFKRVQKGGDGNVKAEPLVLLKATETDCILSGGLTGFTVLNEQDDSSVVHEENEMFGVDFGVKSLILEKAGRFSSAGNYFDSGIFATAEKIDLTNYNTVTVDFYYLTNYNSNYIASLGSAFFKLDLTEDIPQKNSVYDWSDWEDMHGYNRQYGKYYMDISKILGKHELCFGIQHGSYSNGYNNVLVISKIMLS